MIYKIIRIESEDDEITEQSFEKYSDAYDLLEKLYGDSCCSDAEYGYITYYDIVEISKTQKYGESKTDCDSKTKLGKNI